MKPARWFGLLILIVVVPIIVCAILRTWADASIVGSPTVADFMAAHPAFTSIGGVAAFDLAGHTQGEDRGNVRFYIALAVAFAGGLLLLLPFRTRS
jgi:quinol-cytochrome oxidoreductase complex cytochrome b subunit